MSHAHARALFLVLCLILMAEAAELRLELQTRDENFANDGRNSVRRYRLTIFLTRTSDEDSADHDSDSGALSRVTPSQQRTEEVFYNSRLNTSIEFCRPLGVCKRP